MENRQPLLNTRCSAERRRGEIDRNGFQIRPSTPMGAAYLTFLILPSPITVHASLPTDASALYV